MAWQWHLLKAHKKSTSLEVLQQRPATEAVRILLQVTNLQCMVSVVKEPELRMPLPLSL